MLSNSLHSKTQLVHMQTDTSHAVFHRCSIQWMDLWDDNGMQAVATARLQPVMAGTGKGASDASKVVQHVVALHNSRLPAGATPRHYVAFVALCSSLYAKKRSQLIEQQDFLKVPPAAFWTRPCLVIATPVKLTASTFELDTLLYRPALFLEHCHCTAGNSCAVRLQLTQHASTALSCQCCCSFVNPGDCICREAWASSMGLLPLWTRSQRRPSSSGSSSKPVRYLLHIKPHQTAVSRPAL